MDTGQKAVMCLVQEVVASIGEMPDDARIRTINEVRAAIHEVSPFKDEPVDLIQWVPAATVAANDYNPNSVAPPEMELLRHSINHDGYTQPVVTWESNDGREVIDGFHRTRVCKECDDVRARVMGYLPVVTINDSCVSRNDRIASTIRHNRARGKHQVDSMSDIVVELKRRNWSNARICRELGMDDDEVLRLCQVTGLAELFSDQEFSRAWSVDGEVTEADFDELSDDISTYGDETDGFRTVNTSDESRIFHTYDKWECHKAGFYKGSFDGLSKDECEAMYVEVLSDQPRFASILEKVISEWVHSCEHYLTNAAMNRLAWLGQAAVCYDTGVPSAFRGGWFLLTDEDRDLANQTALEYLNKWLVDNGREQVTLAEAVPGRQSEIY
jgi:ParB-like chromosome segregation protein Spo0J